MAGHPGNHAISHANGRAMRETLGYRPLTPLRFVVRRVDRWEAYDYAGFAWPEDAIAYSRQVFQEWFVREGCHRMPGDDNVRIGVVFADTGDIVYSIGREGERRNLSPIMGDTKGTC
jgi:hypothetical protein